MAISEEAPRNHDALFPEHASTLTRTDPELIEIFDNWAFDDVLRDGTLDARTRLMVKLAAFIACHAVNEYRAGIFECLCGSPTQGPPPRIESRAQPTSAERLSD